MSRPFRAPPLVAVGTVCEEYAHVARQCCMCGSHFQVHAERVEADPLRHVLIARCVNVDCGNNTKETHFWFQLTPDLCGGGLGRALATTVNPADPARTFPDMTVGCQIAIGLLTTWVAARAAGVDAASLTRIVTDAVRLTGADPTQTADVLLRLEAIGGEFSEILAVLAKSVCRVPE